MRKRMRVINLFLVGGFLSTQIACSSITPLGSVSPEDFKNAGSRLSNGVLLLKGYSDARSKRLAIPESRAMVLADVCHYQQSYVEDFIKSYEGEFRHRFTTKDTAEKFKSGLLVAVTGCKTAGLLPVSDLKGRSGDYHRWYSYPIARELRSVLNRELDRLGEEVLRDSMEETQAQMDKYIDEHFGE